MASSQPDQNHPTDREERHSSSHGGDNHHLQDPPPANGYPPATGYPPTMGYPAYQYDPYNPNYDYGAQQQEPNKRKISNIFRGIIGGLIFFVLFASVVSIITWLVLHPAIPIFHVSNMTVTDFNISSSSAPMKANWVANISARNPNEKLDIKFEDIDAYIIYNDEYLVASSSVKPFSMNTKQNAWLVAKLSTADNSSDTEGADNLREKEMEKMATERNLTGKVRFEMRMMLWGTFKSGNWWARHVLIKVYCENLQIGFLDKNSTSGNLANGNSLHDCLVTA